MNESPQCQCAADKVRGDRDREQGPAKHGALKPSWEGVLVHLLCLLPGTSSPSREMLLELAQRNILRSASPLWVRGPDVPEENKSSCAKDPQLVWSVRTFKLCPSEMVLSKDTLGLLLAVLPASRHAGFISKLCPPSPVNWGGIEPLQLNE